MTLTFDEAMKFTSTIGDPNSYGETDLRGLWKAASSLHPGATILEVGCGFGRSTSLLAQIAKVMEHKLILIDPFNDPLSASSLVTTLRAIGCPFELHYIEPKNFNSHDQVDMIHIDGDTSRLGLAVNCMKFLPMVKVSGYACFYGYGHELLPDVKPTVDSFITKGWDNVGLFNTCRVLQRQHRWSSLKGSRK